ncbi:hypothetical protein [Krasilnikovia sp. MM14-A1004]|uniref:hypothetical protein n=1 Tax=Krasilnikovia sp. MM14-A1004 TaxID=3373541 RepID=UPI00399D4F72
MTKRRTSIILAGALLAALLPVAATYAQETKPKQAQSQPKPRYTNSTNVSGNCPVYWNHPRVSGKTGRSWPAGPATTSRRLGVRYVSDGYAMVIDYHRAPTTKSKGTFPWWGWVATTGCLVDPHARHFPRGTTSAQDRRDRPDREDFAPAIRSGWAVRGDDSVRRVELPPTSKPGGHLTPIRLGSDATLRSGPQKFVIGNLARHEQILISRSQCRTAHGKPYTAQQWVKGYAPAARRSGWVQASHLPACTR